MTLQEALERGKKRAIEGQDVQVIFYDKLGEKYAYCSIKTVYLLYPETTGKEFLILVDADGKVSDLG